MIGIGVIAAARRRAAGSTVPIGASGATVPFLGSGTYPASFYDATGNRTWLAWEGWDGSRRVVYVQTYDHTNHRWEKRYFVAPGRLIDDDHGAPAICMDADGYVHLFYGAHVGQLQYFVTTSARDPTAWTRRGDIDSTASYPHPAFVGSTLYLFLRTSDGVSQPYWTRYKTTALSGGNATWGSPQNVANFSGGRFYQSSCHVVGTKIHFAAAYADANDTDRANVYHFVYDTSDDSIKNTDSSVSTAVGSQPISKATADTSYRPESPARTDVAGFCITPDATIHIAYIDSASNPWSIKYTNNSGSGWSAPTTITTLNEVSSIGFIAETALVPRADNSVEFWYQDDPLAAYTYGGDMKRIVRSSGGAWGSAQLMLKAGGTIGLARPTAVQAANEDLFVFFTEVAANSLDSSAGGLKFYGFGASGFVPGGLPIFLSGPTIVGPSGFTGTGDKLTAQNLHNGTSETYQWKSNGSNIVGATSQTYTLVSGDVGNSITVEVVATNHVGSTTVDSPAVTAVTPAFSSQTLTLADTSAVTLADTSSITLSNRTA